MKTYLTISLLFISLLGHAQINLVEPFGNLCALGNSLVVKSDTIHIAGTTCVDIGNNQFKTAGFIGGYDLSGTLLYYEQIGDTQRGFRGEKILIDSSGNKYILGTYSFDSLGNPINIGVFIQKRNSNNQVLWTTEYQDSISSVYYFTRDGLILNNGNIALVGADNPGTWITSGVPDQDILFLVFDINGNLITRKRIGTNQAQEEAHGICVYDNNRIAIGARKNFPGANDRNWVLMLDYQGNVLDEYISASNRRIGVWDIVKTQDGGLVCASTATDGDFPTPENKNYVEKLDSNLNKVWEYTIDGFFSSWNLGTSIAETDNGDIIVGGNYASPTTMPGFVGFDAFMMRLSALGDSIWHKGYYYSKVTFSEAHNMYDLAINNDHIYFVGDANDFDLAPPLGQSMWLVSTDSNGVISGMGGQIKRSNEVLVYPNPAQSSITVTLQEDLSVRHLEILDVHGRCFYGKNHPISTRDITISTWPNGMYFYKIQSGKGILRGKFLKN